MDRDQADRLQDRLTAGAHGGHRRGRGGGGGSQFRGGGGGGGGANSRNRETTISKTLSRLLRHQAENAGIKLDDEGYAPLDRVMAWAPLRNLSPTLDEIRSLVASNDKQRFTLKLRGEGDGEGEGEQAGQEPADFLIRANQGHSIKLESTAHLEQLTPATVPPTVVHGTYFAFWPRIVASGGLKPMTRTHVHCATGLPEGSGSGPDAAVVSGMRRDAELLVYVDAARSMRDGALTWWRSANGVVLCEGDAEAGLVPSRYFAEVRGREGSGVGVLWKDGEWVADLPAGLKIVVPHGKQRGGGGGGRGRGRGRGRGA